MTIDQKHPITQEYYGPDFTALQNQDPENAAVVISELERQRHGLKRLAVGLDAVGPEVVSHQVARRLRFAANPGQADL